MPDSATIEDRRAAPLTAGSDLEDWLRWQESLNPRLVDLGLERCARVAEAMGLGAPSMPVVTVAGTNGKGSCIAYLTAILESAGFRVAAYTSPHLARYNESLRIHGRQVRDQELLAAFDNVERVRGDVPLTFFEFRTLAALDIIAGERPDVALLEVGLGGRLDAVNLVDADVAVVTTVDVDHVDWLGPDRESIGREKAGIFRRRRPAVYGEPSPPRSVVEHARALDTELNVVGEAYSWWRDGDGWCWRGAGVDYEALPAPGMSGAFQYANAATAIMAARLLAPRLCVEAAAIRDGVARARLPGRQQILPGPVERIVDVAHNGQAARELAVTLGERPCEGRTHAVIGMLADKDVSAVAGALAGQVDIWHAASLPGPRGGDGAALGAVLLRLAPNRAVSIHGDVAAAWQAAMGGASEGDRIVAFGSFVTARAVLELVDG